MSPGQFRAPRPELGDPDTIGGYMAVHDRPAAFEGADGFSYSVEIMTEALHPDSGWSAYFLFIKWARIGAQVPEGHLETGVVASGDSEAAVRAAAGAHPLSEVKAMLDTLIDSARDTRGPARRWWDVMNDDASE